MQCRQKSWFSAGQLRLVAYPNREIQNTIVQQSTLKTISFFFFFFYLKKLSACFYQTVIAKDFSFLLVSYCLVSYWWLISVFFTCIIQLIHTYIFILLLLIDTLICCTFHEDRKRSSLLTRWNLIFLNKVQKQNKAI